jgi:hypothetical protein
MIEKTITELTAAITALTAQLAANAGTTATCALPEKKVEPEKKPAVKKVAAKKVAKTVEAEVVDTPVKDNTEVDITEDVLRDLGMKLLKAKQMVKYNEIVTSFGAKKIAELELGDYDACYTQLRTAVNAL